MTVYVWRDGELVDKEDWLQFCRTVSKANSLFPKPMISRRFDPYQSPIDGKEITSWAARDKDLRDSNSYDPRDISRKQVSDERPEPQQLPLPFD